MDKEYYVTLEVRCRVQAPCETDARVLAGMLVEDPSVAEKVWITGMDVVAITEES